MRWRKRTFSCMTENITHADPFLQTFRSFGESNLNSSKMWSENGNSGANP